MYETKKQTNKKDKMYLFILISLTAFLFFFFKFYLDFFKLTFSVHMELASGNLSYQTPKPNRMRCCNLGLDSNSVILNSFEDTTFFSSIFLNSLFAPKCTTEALL